MADTTGTSKGRTRRTAKAGSAKAKQPRPRRRALDGDEGLRHARDCPRVGDVAGEPGSRVERFEEPTGGGVTLVTERCLDCGEQDTIEREGAE